MATFTLTVPPKTNLTNGKQITFKAPSDCNNITGIIIKDTEFQLQNSGNTAVANGAFKSGAMISVVLDAQNKIAYLLNENIETSNAVTELQASINDNERDIGNIQVEITNIKNTLNTKVDTIKSEDSLPTIPDAEKTFKANAVVNITKSNGTTLTMDKEPFLKAHPIIAFTDSDTPTTPRKFGDPITYIESVNKDSNGHLTKINSKKFNIPKDTATTSADGLMSKGDKSKLDGVANNANNYTHPTYNGTKEVTADNWDSSPKFGNSFNIPKVKFNNEGHIISFDSRTITIPKDKASASEDGLMSKEDKSKLDGIANNANNYTHPTYTARTGVPTKDETPGFGDSFQVTQPKSDDKGHITEMNNRTITIPATLVNDSEPGLMPPAEHIRLRDDVITSVAIETIGLQSNGVTDARKDGNQLTLIRDKKFLTEHPDIPSTSKETTFSPDFGGKFKTAIITKDDDGHIKTLDTKEITLPSNDATQATHGLMSATDKKRLDTNVADTVTTTNNNESASATDYKKRAVTTITKTGTEIKVNKGYEFLIKHPPISSTADSEPKKKLNFGEPFKAITDVTRDSNQHVTSMTKMEFTAPDTVSSATVNGLMTSDDYKRLHNIVADTVNTTGTGNAITSITKSGTVVTADKSTTFLSGQKFNAVLTTTWDDSLTQQINIAGITSDDIPIIDLDCDSSNYEDAAYEFNRIYRAESVNGGIRFYAESKTKIDINLFIVILKSVTS